MVRRSVFALAVFVLGILGAMLFLPQPAMAQEGGGLSRSEISMLGTGLSRKIQPETESLKEPLNPAVSWAAIVTT